MAAFEEAGRDERGKNQQRRASRQKHHGQNEKRHANAERAQQPPGHHHLQQERGDAGEAREEREESREVGFIVKGILSDDAELVADDGGRGAPECRERRDQQQKASAKNVQDDLTEILGNIRRRARPAHFHHLRTRLSEEYPDQGCAQHHREADDRNQRFRAHVPGGRGREESCHRRSQHLPCADKTEDSPRLARREEVVRHRPPHRRRHRPRHPHPHVNQRVNPAAVLKRHPPENEKGEAEEHERPHDQMLQAHARRDADVDGNETRDHQSRRHDDVRQAVGIGV